MSIKSNRKNRQRGFRYSSLEERRLLAGDVRVVENVNLYLRGDNLDNQIEIVVEDDELRINGLDGTTINGKDSFVVQGTSVTESGVTFEGGLRAHFGPGHDDVQVIDAIFESSSIVYGGTGDDNIDVVDSQFLHREACSKMTSLSPLWMDRILSPRLARLSTEIRLLSQVSTRTECTPKTITTWEM